MTTTDEIIASLRRAVPDGDLLDEAADALEAGRALADDLATKIATATAAWDAEDVQERNDLSDDFWRAMGGLFGALTSYRKARA
jgi:hypothetical protein